MASAHEHGTEKQQILIIRRRSRLAVGSDDETGESWTMGRRVL